MRAAKSHWFAFAVGIGLFALAMNAEALAVWQGFGRGSVLLAELGLLLPVIAFTLLGFPRLSRAGLRLPRLTPSALVRQALAGVVFATLALFVSFAPITIYGAYYQAFPLAALDAGIKYHQDTAFHSALIQSIINFGFPSTGQHLSPVTFYYTLSHYTDALASRLSGISPFEASGLLFHFKKTIIVVAITVFLARVTKGRSALYRALAVTLALPVFIGTWTLIGSEGLWTASVILLAVAPRVWKILRTAAPTHRNYQYLTLVLLLIGVAKFSSGLMLALFIGLWLIQSRARSARLWVYSTVWLAMYALLAYLFSISNTTASLPTSLGSAFNYWLVRGADRSAPSLVALYVLLVVSVGFWLRYRSVENRRFVLTQLGALLVLGVLASHFAKTDEFYFTFGVLFIVLLVGVQLLAAQLVVTWRKPLTLLMAAALIFGVAAVPQTSLHLTGSSKHDIESAAKKANNAYLADYNKITGSNLTVTKLLKGAKIKKPAPGAATNFVNRLGAFQKANGLGPSNSVLWVSKHLFLTQTGFMVGKWWAKGLLMYAITGVPLVHGSPTLWLGYGFANYTDADLWTNHPTDLDAIRAAGKNVIVVKSILDPRFEVMAATSR